jgi:hypothetical protein
VKVEDYQNIYSDNTSEKRLRKRQLKKTFKWRFDDERNTCILRVYKMFRPYAFVRQRYRINEDNMKELALSFKNYSKFSNFVKTINC